MNKKLALAVLLMVVLTVPAFASVQNVKVGGDIDSTLLMRNNFDLGLNIIGDRNQNVFLTQTRVNVDADLTDNVSTVIGLINERSWGEEDDPSANNTDIDINVAYAEFREFLYQPLTVRVGRQNNIRYGNGFIFDATGRNNTSGGSFGTVAQDLTKRTALDAVRMTFDYNPLTLDFVYAKADANIRTGAPDRKDDVDVYVGNANWKLGDEMNTEVEGLFVAKIDKSTQALTSPGSNKADTVYAPGFRASTNPIKGLNIQGEVAWQMGNKVLTTATAAQNQDREAMGYQAIVNYALPVEQFSPVITGVYTRISGDRNSSESTDNAQPRSREKWTAWNPLFENQGGGTIYNTLYDLTNANIYTVSASIKPIEDVMAKFTWTGLTLDKKVRGGSMSVRQPDGGTLTVATNEDKGLGNEFDFEVIWDYTEDVQFGANFGWYDPGDALTSANNDTATQLIVHTNVTF